MKLKRAHLRPTDWKAPLCTHCGRPLPRRAKGTPEIRAEVSRKYFRERKRQIELALEYDVSQATIARWVANS